MQIYSRAGLPLSYPEQLNNTNLDIMLISSLITLDTYDHRTRRRATQPSGDSIDAIQNTSLVEPELESSGRPHSQSALRRAQEAAEERQRIMQRVQDDADFMRTEQRQRRLEAQTSAALHALYSHRSSGERQRLEQELLRRVEEFAESDLDACTEWTARQ